MARLCLKAAELFLKAAEQGDKDGNAWLVLHQHCLVSFDTPKISMHSQAIQPRHAADLRKWSISVEATETKLHHGPHVPDGSFPDLLAPPIKPRCFFQVPQDMQEGSLWLEKVQTSVFGSHHFKHVLYTTIYQYYPIFIYHFVGIGPTCRCLGPISICFFSHYFPGQHHGFGRQQSEESMKLSTSMLPRVVAQGMEKIICIVIRPACNLETWMDIGPHPLRWLQQVEIAFCRSSPKQNRFECLLVNAGDVSNRCTGICRMVSMAILTRCHPILVWSGHVQMQKHVNCVSI